MYPVIRPYLSRLLQKPDSTVEPAPEMRPAAIAPARRPIEAKGRRNAVPPAPKAEQPAGRSRKTSYNIVGERMLG